MTDAEIIKALEERIKELKEDYKRLQLLDAPMDCFEASHIDNMRILSNVLDLINRQKAEYEDLYKKYCELAKNTNERVPVLIKEVQKSKAELRAEAIKEFAERLKLKVDIDLCEAIECSDYLYDLPKLIDNLVKEMAGD